jgi:regulator of sigma E protease
MIIDVTAVPDSIYLEKLDIYAGQLGIRSPAGEFRRLGISEAIIESAQECWSITVGMVRGISRLISGNAQMGEIGGPVRIAQFSRDAALQGVTSLVFFIALISINLGLVNLLPIPALDGGHLTFFIIEAIIGKPLPIAWQNILMRGGIAFLLSLMLFVTIYDIIRGVFN